MTSSLIHLNANHHRYLSKLVSISRRWTLKICRLGFSEIHFSSQDPLLALLKGRHDVLQVICRRTITAVVRSFIRFHRASVYSVGVCVLLVDNEGDVVVALLAVLTSHNTRTHTHLLSCYAVLHCMTPLTPQFSANFKLNFAWFFPLSLRQSLSKIEWTAHSHVVPLLTRWCKIRDALTVLLNICFPLSWTSQWITHAFNSVSTFNIFISLLSLFFFRHTHTHIYTNTVRYFKFQPYRSHINM